MLSLSQLGQDSDVLGHEVQMKDAELQKWTPLVDKELQDSSKSQLSNMIQEVTQLKAILQELEHPLAYMTFTLDKVQDGLESKSSQAMNVCSNGHNWSHYQTQSLIQRSWHLFRFSLLIMGQAVKECEL